MSIEQVLRKIVEKARWEHAMKEIHSRDKTDSSEAIVHALLSSFDIKEKGSGLYAMHFPELEKMKRLIQLAREHLKGCDDMAIDPEFEQCLKDLEEE